MEWVSCSKCQNMVAVIALEVHNELNHPKREVTSATFSALAKAREIRARMFAERKEKAEQLTAAWEGRA